MSWPAFSSSEQHAAIAARAQRAAARLEQHRPRPAQRPGAATDVGYLDRRLLLKVAAGPASFEQLAAEIDGPHADAPRWRVIDRRLASLRAAGLITYTATIGWSIKENR